MKGDKFTVSEVTEMENLCVYITLEINEKSDIDICNGIFVTRRSQKNKLVCFKDTNGEKWLIVYSDIQQIPTSHSGKYIPVKVTFKVCFDYLNRDVRCKGIVINPCTDCIFIFRSQGI